MEKVEENCTTIDLGTNKDKIKKEAKIKNEKGNLEKTSIDPNDNISNPIWGVWDQKEYCIPDSALTIKGYSVAALRTNFYINELGILLDAGLSAPNYKIDHIFITHGHSDHCANLPFHIYGSRLGGYKTQIHVPKDSLEYLNNFIVYGYCMSSHPGEDIKKEALYVHNYYDIIPRVDKDAFEIVVKNRKFKIEIIKCIHSVPCIAYGFIEKRIKLKEEYKLLKGSDIGELKKQGVEINYEQELPNFLYLGDTSKEIFKDDRIVKYKNVMIECTFLYDDDYENADKTFHIHWKDLKPFVNENKNVNFILIHFSQRYRKSEILEFFSKESDIKNIHLWLN